MKTRKLNIEVAIHRKLDQLIDVFMKGKIETDLPKEYTESIIQGLIRMNRQKEIISMNWKTEIMDESIIRIALGIEDLLEKDELRVHEKDLIQKLKMTERFKTRYLIKKASLCNSLENSY